MDDLVPLAGIYVITHISTGRKYVGQSFDADSRIKHYRYGSGHAEIGRAIKEHGIDAFSFEVIERIHDEKQLSDREAYWIATLGTVSPNGFNIRSCGTTKFHQGRENLTPAASAGDRQSRARQALKESGGRTITFKLDKAGSDALAALCATGVDQQSAVRGALLLYASKMHACAD